LYIKYSTAYGLVTFWKCKTVIQIYREMATIGFRTNTYVRQYIFMYMIHAQEQHAHCQSFNIKYKVITLTVSSRD